MIHIDPIEFMQLMCVCHEQGQLVTSDRSLLIRIYADSVNLEKNKLSISLFCRLFIYFIYLNHQTDSPI